MIPLFWRVTAASGEVTGSLWRNRPHPGRRTPHIMVELFILDAQRLNVYVMSFYTVCRLFFSVDMDLLLIPWYESLLSNREPLSRKISKSGVQQVDSNSNKSF